MSGAPLATFSTPGEAVAELMTRTGDEVAYKCCRCDYYHVAVRRGGEGSKLGHMARSGNVVAMPWDWE